MLVLKVLGPPRLEQADGRVITVRSSKALALLSVLAFDGPTLRTTLASLLWQRQHDHAMHSLRNALHALKHDLGEHASALHANRSTIWLEDARYTVDAHAIPTATPEELLTLWRGPFLDGLPVRDSEPWEEWRQHWEHTLAQRYVERALHLAVRALESSEVSVAVTLAERILTLDPLSEQAAALLIHAHRAAGRSGAAHAFEQDFKRRYRAELGDDPDLQPPELSVPVPASVAASRHNLPALRTSFVGREQERSNIARLLTSGAPLVTLHGLAGSGKTRLALQAARDLAAQDVFDGVYFVPLDDVTEPVRLVPRIAEAAGLTLQGHPDPLTALQASIGRQRMLLLLDNFEQLRDAAPQLNALLGGCENLALLVTSREQLNLKAEHVLSLSGLSTTLGEGKSDAVQLFIERANQVNAALMIQEQDLPRVQQICHAADGLPLAVELLASLTRHWTLEEVTAHALSNPVELETPLQDVRDRHRSLRAAFEQSWSLLSEWERLSLARTSVFEGGFTLEAAREVARATAKHLAGFVEKSLLQRRGNRYHLHPLLREYLRLKLSNGPSEPGATQGAHARYYLGILSALNAEASGGVSPALLSFVHDEESNIRALMRHLLDRREYSQLAPLAEPLAWLFPLYSRHAEGLETYRDILTALPEGDEHAASARLAFLTSYGFMHLFIGRLGGAVELLSAAAASADSLSDPVQYTRALDGLGEALYRSGRFREAVPPLRRALEIVRSLSDPVREMRILNAYALALAFADQPALAEHMHAQARELHASVPVPDGVDVVWLHMHHGILAMHREQPDVAFEAWERSIQVATTVGAVGLIPVVQAFKTLVHLDLGVYQGRDADLREAWRLCEETHPVTLLTGELFASNFFHVLQGVFQAREGDARSGWRHAREGLLRADATQNGVVYQFTLPFLLDVLAALDDTRTLGVAVQFALFGGDSNAWLRGRVERWLVQRGLPVPTASIEPPTLVQLVDAVREADGNVNR